MSGTWVRLATNIIADPKMVNLSARAFRTYINGLAFAGEHLTDGHIDRDAYSFIRGACADELVDKGLWDPAPIGSGWTIRNYLEHQDSAEQVKKRRADAAERARRSRAGKKGDVDA